MINEPSQRTTEEIIAPEPEPQDKSDQVREPAAPSIVWEALVEIEGMVLKPVHTPTAEGELQLDLKKKLTVLSKGI